MYCDTFNSSVGFRIKSINMFTLKLPFKILQSRDGKISSDIFKYTAVKDFLISDKISVDLICLEHILITIKLNEILTDVYQFNKKSFRN